jgi:hypothetical protein
MGSQMFAIILFLQPMPGVQDTLQACVEKGCVADSDEFMVLFGAGCSLRCAVDWIVTASSELPPEDGNSYSASNVDDIDSTTAWVEGAEGWGIGESLTVSFIPWDNGQVATSTYGFTIQNGYARSPEVWEENGRVHLLGISLNGERFFVAELADTWLPQTVQWDEWGSLRLSNGDFITLEILSVYEGTLFEDTSISGLMFWGAH